LTSHLKKYARFYLRSTISVFERSRSGIHSLPRSGVSAACISTLVYLVLHHASSSWTRQSGNSFFFLSLFCCLEMFDHHQFIIKLRLFLKQFQMTITIILLRFFCFSLLVLKGLLLPLLICILLFFARGTGVKYSLPLFVAYPTSLGFQWSQRYVTRSLLSTKHYSSFRCNSCF
jgi:hypothetical protein